MAASSLPPYSPPTFASAAAASAFSRAAFFSGLSGPKSPPPPKSPRFFDGESLASASRARATSRSSPSEAADGGVCLSVAASGSQSSKPATAQSPPGSRRESATLASPSGVLALIGPS